MIPATARAKVGENCGLVGTDSTPSHSPRRGHDRETRARIGHGIKIKSTITIKRRGRRTALDGDPPKRTATNYRWIHISQRRLRNLRARINSSAHLAGEPLSQKDFVRNALSSFSSLPSVERHLLLLGLLRAGTYCRRGSYTFENQWALVTGDPYEPTPVWTAVAERVRRAPTPLCLGPEHPPRKPKRRRRCPLPPHSMTLRRLRTSARLWSASAPAALSFGIPGSRRKASAHARRTP
jgi:hypothetical protein